MSNIEIVDRRRNKDHHVEPVKAAEPEKGKGGWKSVGYMIQLRPASGGMPIPIGRAVGVRDDGMGPFAADYILPNIWGPDFNWQSHAKKRLDTFVNCECRSQARCAVHELLMPQWETEDVRRINTANEAPMPEAIELFMRAEIAARASRNPQPNIVVPR